MACFKACFGGSDIPEGKVSIRVRGECTVWLGTFGTRYKCHVTTDRGMLICQQRQASGEPDPEPKAPATSKDGWSEGVAYVALPGANLTCSGRRCFTIRCEALGSGSCSDTWHFRAASEQQGTEWLHMLSKQKGLNRRLQDFYRVGANLGTGGTCIVRKCQSKITGETFAVKKASVKDDDSKDTMHRELRILQMLSELEDHPAIPKLADYFYDDDGHVQLVVELLGGGSLLDRILELHTFSEAAAGEITRTIVEGLEFLHGSGIAHRDIKLDNFVYDSTDPAAQLKIIDYDCAAVMMGDGKGETPCGTDHYMAPEIVNAQQHTKAVDLWSLGCLVYTLLVGCVPFYDEDEDVEHRKILNCEYTMEGDTWTGVSEDAKDFVRHLLVIDPLKRPSASQCLEHVWLHKASEADGGNNLPKSPLATAASIKISVGAGSLARIKTFSRFDAPERLHDKRLRVHRTLSMPRIAVSETMHDLPSESPRSAKGQATPRGAPRPPSRLSRSLSVGASHFPRMDSASTDRRLPNGDEAKVLGGHHQSINTAQSAGKEVGTAEVSGVQGLPRIQRGMSLAHPLADDEMEKLHHEEIQVTMSTISAAADKVSKLNKMLEDTSDVLPPDEDLTSTIYSPHRA